MIWGEVLAKGPFGQGCAWGIDRILSRGSCGRKHFVVDSLWRCGKSLAPRCESLFFRQPYSVIGNTPDFDSVFPGSSPGRATLLLFERSDDLSRLFFGLVWRMAILRFGLEILF